MMEKYNRERGGERVAVKDVETRPLRTPGRPFELLKIKVVLQLQTLTLAEGSAPTTALREEAV